MRGSTLLLAVVLVTAPQTALATAPPVAASTEPAEPVLAEPPKDPARFDEDAVEDEHADEDEVDRLRHRELPHLTKLRRVELGADLGVQTLHARVGNAGYAAGLAWAGSARTQLAPYLGLRLLARHSTHAVSVARGGLAPSSEPAALAGTRFSQPPLDVWLMAARLEPTWVMTPRLRLWLGLGAGWLRVEAPPTEGELGGGCQPREVAGTTVNCTLTTASRTALATELAATLGATVEIVPRWLTLNFSSGLGALVDPSGSLFTSQQAVAAGSLYQVTGFPRFGASGTLLVGVGLIL